MSQITEPTVALSLTVKRAADALDFYVKALGAVELFRMPTPDGGVAHAEFMLDNTHMNISDELAVHAGEELAHALIIANQIDYLGGMPTVTAKPVKTSEKATDMLQFDLDNETETIRNYRERVDQCEALGEYAMSEEIREILRQEQEHQIDLATALGKDVPKVSAKKA